MTQLNGKVAIITGGARGMGAATVRTFVEAGARVAIADVLTEAGAQLAAELGDAARFYALDVSNPDNWAEVVRQVETDLGPVDILVNNAGTQYPNEDLTTLSDEQWLNTFDTNIHSIFFLTKAALPHLKEDDSIINTTSVNAYIGPQMLIDYTATKGAIVSFTRALSNQIAGKGIRVNAVAPGPVWTPLQPATLGDYNPELLENFGHETPMGRAGQPSELGPIYVFLASLDSSYISGQVIHPNGGTMVGG